MARVDKTKRWTILNFDEKLKKSILEYAKENGYTIPRAIKELVSEEIGKWKAKKK